MKIMRGIKSKAKKSRKKKKATLTLRKFRRRVLSVSQLLGKIGKIREQRQIKGKVKVKVKVKGKGKAAFKKPVKKPVKLKPLIPPKSLTLILTEKPRKSIYNRRIIDYKHCGLLENYIGGGGKILPRRQTLLNAKQQRYISSTIKTARIMGLLPFVSKEKGYFR
jgi:ribosomal protein S18